MSTLFYLILKKNKIEGFFKEKERKKERKKKLLILLKIDTAINILIHFYSFSDATFKNSCFSNCVLLFQST